MADLFPPTEDTANMSVMYALFRESPAGQLLRLITRNKILQYPEEKPGYKVPQEWLDVLNSEKPPSPPPAPGSSASSVRPLANSDAEDKETDKIKSSPPDDTDTAVGSDVEKAESPAPELDLARTRSQPIIPQRTKDGLVLVDFYTTDDPENPYNWPSSQKLTSTFILCFYTFVVYASSSIYLPSLPGIIAEYQVGQVEASLGLALYVLGYGIGPLIFSPLSEIPVIGRNPVYIITMAIYVIISLPAPLIDNFAGLMVLRFLQGFFGSPCLASGGASLGDMFSLMNLPYALVAWVSAAYCGPALGPMLAGFSVPAMSWRWSLWEIFWASIPAFLLMFLLLPETSTPTILLRRARRIRKLTGNPRFMSQSELDQRAMKTSEVLVDALIKPIEITIKDPAILFVQVYTGILYGIYYSFFESFPLVYVGIYGMSLSHTTLVFLCVLIACGLGVAIYVGYIYFYMNPLIMKHGFPVQERRLVPALYASVGPVIGLFLYAWTARESIHWTVPTIGIIIYGGSAFVLMQCIFVYVPISYPKYAASLFAGNDFFRSSLAFAAVLFATPLYHNMGISRGTSLLGGLSFIGIVGIFALYHYGARLRAMSKFAISE